MISAVVITLNEARNIVDCIQALRKVTDDVIVLDSGSTDGTQDLATKHGAKVIPIEWIGYGPTKNLAIEHVKNEWILSIDADEVLTPELITEIMETELNPDYIYAINILPNYCGDWIYHSGWYPSYKKRLYHTLSVRWDDREVHENLCWEGDKTVVRFKNVLHHYSYRTAQDHILKGEKYAMLGAKHLIANGKKVSWIKQTFGPAFRFFRMFILQLGFLDKKAGFLLAKRESRMVALRYKYYREMSKID